jgi:hypothetical protein
MAAAEEKAKDDIPQLGKEERLELQNIMLRMALENERVGRLEAEISSARKEFQSQELRLKMWQGAFSGKLKATGLSIEQVDIDAESGKVTILNVVEMPKGE